MTYVLITCPRTLLCNIGLYGHTRAQRRDRVGPVEEGLRTLGGPVTHHYDERLSIVMPDPADAVLAVGELARQVPDFTFELMSFVASRGAGELIGEDTGPVQAAWQALTAHWEPRVPFDIRHGWGARRHFGETIERHPLPERIAEQQLPARGLALWDVNQRTVIHVDHDGFAIGAGHDADYQVDSYAVSRKHVWFDHANGDWRVHDADSTSGFYLNDQRGGAMQRLLPGMVLQFARPHSYVVLSCGAP
jgi:hypothetical protein